jgi:hypothetical protein
MAEIEVFHLTPSKGKHYYAILATRTWWDPDASNFWGGKGGYRYFANEADKRYMGTFDSSMSYGSDYGKRYTEVYIKDNKRINLNYEYEGSIFVIEADVPPKTTIMNPEEDEIECQNPVPIDKHISASKY